MKYLVYASLAIVGCTLQKASFDTVEDSRRLARENSQYVAVDFRRQNTTYAQLDIYMRGDSTISSSCPQGDGWASVDLRTKDGATVTKLKCSTVSASIGCLEESDFKTKSYAQQEGNCSSEIPFPLPKLVK